MFTRVTRLLGRDLRGDLAAEARGLIAPEPAAGLPVTAADVARLPETARRYLDFMDVIGHPRDRAFVARLRGRFRLRPGQRFMPFEAWQYNTGAPIARLFRMRIDFAGFVPMVGGDTYINGTGRMLGKLLGLIPVADGKGPEFDAGELVTWLNDAVLVAPSMLLDGDTTWADVDEAAFEVSVSDAGRTVMARVEVDERGAPSNFSTRDRYADLPGGLVRAEWTTPIEGWRVVDGRPLPEQGRAIWHLPDGPFTYVEGGFDPGSIRYNPPGSWSTSAVKPARARPIN